MSQAFKLNNGTVLLSLESPAGLYSPAQLKCIAEISDAQGCIVKASEDQRLLIYVPEDKIQEVVTSVQELGLGVRNYQDGLHQATSCIGELCPKHEQDAMGAAMDLSTILADVILESPLKIGINGCATCCVPCHTLDISIIGEANGYRISLGGKTSQIPEMAGFMAEGVPASELSALMLNVVHTFKENAQSGETLQELIERAGATAFVKALAPYSQDAASGDDLFTELNETQEVTPAEIAETEGDSLDLGATDELDLSDLPEAEDMEMDINPNADQNFDSGSEDIPINTDFDEASIGDLDIAANEFDQIDAAGDVAETFTANSLADAGEEVIEDTNDEADLERKLEMSIAEQQTMQTQEVDENNSDRLEAIDMVEHATEMDEGDGLQTSLSEEDIDDSEFIDDDSDLEDSGSTTGEGFGEQCQEMYVADGKINFGFANGATIGFNLNYLKASGGSKQLMLDGRSLVITLVKGGIRVEIDGVEAFLPSDKIAA